MTPSNIGNLNHLIEVGRKESLEVWQEHLVSATRKSWRLHDAICPEASGGKQYSLVPQLPYSPDLAQVVILLFPTLKVHFKNLDFSY